MKPFKNAGPTIWFIIALVLMLWLLSGGPARADSDHHCQGNSCNGSDGDVALSVVTGDTSRAIGLSGGSIDVDINQCLGSTSWGLLTFHKQRLVPNPWCEAEALCRLGFVDACVLAFCTRTSVGGLYTDLVDCKAGMVVIVTEQVEAPDESRETEDDNDDYREQQTEGLAELEKRMDKLDSQRQVSARRYAQEKQKDQQAAQKVIDAYQEKMK